MFDDILIARWRGRHRGVPSVSESEEFFSVRIETYGADPGLIDIDVSEHRLTVRIPGSARSGAHTFDFARATIDVDRVTARSASGTLEVILPKKRGRRIAIT
jgi:HSP20 family molecular chaperone IbpA